VLRNVAPTYDCFGSKADIRATKSHIRFTPESGNLQRTHLCPLWAKGRRLFQSAPTTEILYVLLKKVFAAQSRFNQAFAETTNISLPFKGPPTQNLVDSCRLVPLRA
jgi:hypothetical protein